MPKTSLTHMTIIIILVSSLFSTILPVLAQDELGETFTDNNGILTFSHPAGWHIEQFMPSDLYFLGMSETSVTEYTTSDSILNSAEIILTIIGPQTAEILFAETTPTTLAEVLTLLTDRDPEEQAEFGELETLTLSGHAALAVSMRGPEREGIMIAIDFDGKFVLVGAETLLGAYGPFATTVLAIADTIDYTAPEGIITYKGSDLAFDYPATWFASEMDSLIYIVINEVSSLEGFTPGHAKLMIMTPAGLSELERFISDMSGVPTDYEVAEIALMVIGIWNDSSATFGDEQPLTIGRYEGILFEYVSETTEGIVAFLNVDDGELVVFSGANIGEFAVFEGDIFAILESLVYTPPE